MGLLLLLSAVPLVLFGVFGGGDDDPAPQTDDGDDTSDVRVGGSGNNNLEGDGGDDLLAGFAGDDTLTGRGGADLLVGDTGDDVVLGGEGSDLLLGGRGEDLLQGGAGDDLLVGGQDEDRLEGEGGNDILIDTSGSAELFGGAGNDTLIGLNIGNDRQLLEDVTELDTDAFLSEVEAQFGPQSDTFNRMLLRNLLPLDDAPSFDTMSGGTGDDLLVGDAGDVMTGGSGADVFSAVTPATPVAPADPAFGQVVRVTDFNPAEDQLEVQAQAQGNVAIAVQQRSQGAMVTVNGIDTVLLVGLRADQLNVNDITLTRL
jgi:Ca2+-binding RTX toxin-like protein